jgi:hypothetical protein
MKIQSLSQPQGVRHFAFEKWPPNSGSSMFLIAE